MEHDRYIGRLLDGRYEILEVIGTGGMAVVYKARCHRLNRLVAVKILKDELSKDEEFRRRFHAESQAGAMLSHPNIMAVYDVSTTDAADYIVMELIDGITLKQYMEKKGTLNWKETLHFSMQIAKALEHAHGRGLVHRDIKPHNVMVLKNGSVKVTDFGIARIMSKSTTLTKEALGSVHYISPEQAKGGRVDSRSDIYSLGVVMYEMMTGRAPYDGDSPVAVAIQHINGGAVMPSVLNPNIPGGLEQIIMKAMATDPAKRYDSATALLYDLEEFRKNPGILFAFDGGEPEEVLKIHTPGSVPGVKSTQTTAQKVAAARGGAAGSAPATPAPVQPSQNRRPAAETPAKPPVKQPPKQREDARESRNRTMTATVVICSAVAVVAIIVFLITLLNGGLLGNDTTLVPVPNLIGEVYDELDYTRYPNVHIVLADRDFSDRYAEGYIMDQSPNAGDKVPEGNEVKIWVSMGPEDEDMHLDDLSGMTQANAENYLESLGLIPKVMQENSDEIKEGQVIRTEPAADEIVEPGQTITVYVSLGPATVTARVPDVLGDDKTAAIQTLKNNGFDKYRLEEEDSLESKNSVIRLSVEVGAEVDVATEIVIYYSSGEIIESVPYVAGMTLDEAKALLDSKHFRNIRTEEEYNATVEAGRVIRANFETGVRVDVTTTIVLTISKGPEPTEPPTTLPPETTQPVVTKTFTVALPTDQTEAYVLRIVYDEEVVVLDVTIQPNTATYSFQLTGRGSGECEIYINDVFWRTEKVDFGA